MVFPGFRFLAPLALARGSSVAMLALALAPGEPATDDREKYNVVIMVIMVIVIIIRPRGTRN